MTEWHCCLGSFGRAIGWEASIVYSIALWKVFFFDCGEKLYSDFSTLGVATISPLKRNINVADAAPMVWARSVNGDTPNISSIDVWIRNIQIIIIEVVNRPIVACCRLIHSFSPFSHCFRLFAEWRTVVLLPWWTTGHEYCVSHARHIVKCRLGFGRCGRRLLYCVIEHSWNGFCLFYTLLFMQITSFRCGCQWMKYTENSLEYQNTLRGVCVVNSLYKSRGNFYERKQLFGCEFCSRFEWWMQLDRAINVDQNVGVDCSTNAN